MRYERRTQGITPTVGVPDMPSVPIAPEGGWPVYSGEDSPSLPIAPEGGEPVYPGEDSPSLPIAPEGGWPVYPGSMRTPCRVRVINAALETPPLRVTIGGTVVAESLSYSHIGEYVEVADGFLNVVIATAQRPRKTLMRTAMPFRMGGRITLAVIRTRGRLSLMQIPDETCCGFPQNRALLRCVNLSSNSPPLDITLYDGTLIFGDVQFKEITSYRSARMGSYVLLVTLTPTAADRGIESAEGDAHPEVLVSVPYDARSGEATTLYFLGLVGSGDEPFLVVTVTD